MTEKPMKPIVRFAPSPTGKLHVGNVRTALMNFLFARAQGGQFILRIDDTDRGRSTQAYEAGLKEDLTWLGMVWDDSFNQSARFGLYDEAAQFLRQNGHIYPCYETAEELDRQRKILRTQGKPPIYNRAALGLSAAERAELESAGRQAHWRFKLSGKMVQWNDLVRGAQKVDTGSLSDPVLIRADGTYLYTLPSVVDDIKADITHVIRGEDHVTNSGAQIEIFEALAPFFGSASAPKFAHTPLLVGKDGKSLSKRLGSLSMDQLRERDIEPMAICSLLAKIGTSDPVEARSDMADLVDTFSFSKISRASARFDEAELTLVNSRLLHGLSFEDVKPRLAALSIGGGADFWLLIRSNLVVFDDVKVWWAVVDQALQGQIASEDAEFCALAADLLPEDLDADSWAKWTQTLKERSGRKGKSLFLPLRLALTGLARGPEMDMLIVLLGAERIKSRLRGKNA